LRNNHNSSSMKNNYIKMMVITALVTGAALNAQVSMYVFTQYAGIYTPITAGTVFATPTTDDGAFVNPANPTLNQTTGPGIPIGFTFTFNANVYNVFGIDNNGWIAFGNSSITPNPVNLNNTGLGAGLSGASTAPAILQNRVAGLGRDLVANGGTANLRVETIGTSPNQTCVVQWTNYRSFGSTGDNINFQIRLIETSNRVQVVYGSWTSIGSANSGQVGLRGNANTDFNNRSVVSPNVWATSIAGTANNSAANWNTTGLIPANGQVYEWIPPNPCSGAPAQNTATSNISLICSGGGSTLSLASTYTDVGISYQWYSSTISPVGTWSAVSNATNMVYTATNQTTNTWYFAVITCSNGPASSTAAVTGVSIAATTTSVVPYYEGFEGVVLSNQLPNCSWAASNLPTINQTYTTSAANNRIPHSGNKFASFRFGTNANGDYFYTNGIQMEPGITYSAALWYITDGNPGWSELSIHYGTSQTPSALTPIVAKTGAVIGQFYQLLSHTFTVPNSGLYNVAIKAIGSSTPLFLTWDDLSITIPCELNAPAISITAPTTACLGETVSINATGGDTQVWSNGDTGPTANYVVDLSGSISVMATHTASGCMSTATAVLLVKPSPVISIFPSSHSVCAGSSATLNAVGASTYSWSTTAAGPFVVVAPTTATTYSVVGMNTAGCKGYETINIGVNPLPPVTVHADRTSICVGESVELTAGGADMFEWKASSLYLQANSVTVSPTASTQYSVIGTDANGCRKTEVQSVSVNICAGVSAENISGMKIFPNPASGLVWIESPAESNVVIADVTGRTVMISKELKPGGSIDISSLAAGIYYLTVQTGGESQIFRLVTE
jgi:hypothetical protein